jgi:hypothetical protein
MDYGAVAGYEVELLLWMAKYLRLRRSTLTESGERRAKALHFSRWESDPAKCSSRKQPEQAWRRRNV